MSKFNTPAVNPHKTVNEAGGEAFKKSPKLELISLLLTWFVNSKFYATEKQTTNRLNELVDGVDPEFAAKSAIFARTKWGEGMRSVTHMVAARLSTKVSGKPWATRFYTNIAQRVDDMLEILAIHLSQKAVKGKRNALPAAMKRGFRLAFNSWDAYQLAKYRNEGKTVTLKNAVELLHPKGNARNSKALAELIKGELKQTKTWNAKQSAAGQTKEMPKAEAKAKSWKESVDAGMPYMALLMNMRNIVENCDMATIQIACDQLANPITVRKQGMFPFRYLTAFDEIYKINSEGARRALVAISMAMEAAMSNIPKLEGTTLVVLDTSSSMTTARVAGGSRVVAEAGALFAGAMLKSWQCDLMTFDTTARYVNYNPLDPISTMVRNWRFNGGGTNFTTIFTEANRKYDNIIILSDMQGWGKGGGYYGDSPTQAFAKYRTKFGVQSRIFSFDLAGYGSLQFPENRVYTMAGFSDQNFEIMKLLQSDPNALVHEVESIEL